MNDGTNKKLSWYVSKVSYATGGNNWSINGHTGPTALNPAAGRIDITSKYTHNGLKNVQFNNSNERIYQGAETDDNGEGERAPRQRIHFSGSSLETLANEWKTAIYNSYSNEAVTATPLLQLTSVTRNSGSSYSLTVNSPGSGATYYWVVNDNGINSASATNNSNTYTFTGITTGDILSCYVEYNGRLYASQPYQTHSGNARVTNFSINPTSHNFSSNGGSVVVTVNGNATWSISNLPSWISATYDEENSQITFSTSTNTSGHTSETAYFTDLENNNAQIGTITFSQSASSGCTQTNLSSQTPTNPSSEWQGYGTMNNNLNISGQTLMVGGYQTNNGIGTHANSRLAYNLGGQYSIFSGSVGRDDAADNCGCGTMKLQFEIKADNVVLFSSNLLGTADGKQDFSVNVAGKNNLELIVNDGGDNTWGDHADWLDAILYCGTPPTCTTAPPVPTNVNSSPQTISSGGSSTLSATCTTGVVVWNTGQTANSITVSPTITTSYNAKCVSGTCPASNTVSVGVTVTSSSCSGFSDGTVMGTWNVNGQPLVSRFFHGQYWLTQRAGTTPDVFVVRGSGMLQRSDVSLNNSSYYNMVSCFAWTYSDYGSLQNPPSTTFPTPSGYSLSYSQDGTMIYTANSGGGGGTGCTDTYVSNNWASATIGDGTGPKIGQNYQGGTMNINGTTYSQGIGTHAGSEIVYNLGSHSYANFKASVGRDVSSYSCNCGGQTIVFKVYNHTTGALIGSSTNNPVTQTINQSASDMVVPIAGISSIRLVVEDGGDQIWGDWADWGNARFTCAGSNFREAPAPTEEWFWVSPNPNDGKFIAKVKLKLPQSVQLYLSDIKGNIIKEYSFVGAEGMNNFEINIQDKVTIESIYNIRCQAGEASDSKRMIIEK